ncbi:MAG: BlaI/MecI/CopY family transcriptional regulator [Muribaculaceae bacterium]|nr:BlaI/MecI/CopY family transcriptional regulator [Muribaculaceae bacterium]
MKRNEKTNDLTDKEEQLLSILWQHGPLFVRDMVALYPDPKPHFNTVSTVVRTLEAKGYVDHETLGSTYRYQALKRVDEYRRRSLGHIVKSFFNNSYLGAVSALVEEEKLSADDLRSLIEQIEKSNKSE